MAFPAMHRVGGGEGSPASVFVPVALYPVYKIWGEMYHKIGHVKFIFCEASGFDSKEKRSICKVFSLYFIF